mgnify:FL=1
MKINRVGRRIHVSPSDEDLNAIRQREWLRTGPEAFEELLQAIRAAGLNVPATAYERSLSSRKSPQKHKPHQ